MPTTVTGLLMFVALLLPGLTFVTIREYGVPLRQRSVFRESAVVAAVSVAAWLVLLLAFALLRTVWPSGTPDVGQLMKDPNTYLGTPVGYRLTGAWALGMLVVAVAGASGVGRLIGLRRPHASRISTWSLLFEHWNPDADVRIGCILDDGSYVAGRRGSHNNSPDDGPDRELTLVEPLEYRPPGADELELYEAPAICVPARRIVTMFVTYVQPQDATPGAARSSQVGAEAAQPALAEELEPGGPVPDRHLV